MPKVCWPSWRFKPSERLYLYKANNTRKLLHAATRSADALATLLLLVLLLLLLLFCCCLLLFICGAILVVVIVVVVVLTYAF